MDIIANQLTSQHYDTSGALAFYNYLVSFGQGYNIQFLLHNFGIEFAYQSGTSVLFLGKILTHSVPKWSNRE
jgi:hypothetical protein